MSKIKVNEIDSRSGTTITVASGKTLAGTDIIGSTQIAANAVDTTEIAANAVTLAEMAGLARGKLIVGDASGDPSALTVGTANQVLKSDGTDVAWAADEGLPTQTSNAGKILVTDGTNASWKFSDTKNLLINGNFDIWQRGTSFTGANDYTADRWYIHANGSSLSATRQAFTVGQTDVPNNPTYYHRYNNGTSPVGLGEFNQKIEDVTVLSGLQVTFTIWAKAASGTPNMGLSIYQNFGTGGTATATVLNSPTLWTLSTAWQKFTHTFTMSSVSGKTIGANSYTLLRINQAQDSIDKDVAQAQLERGSVATTYQTRTVRQELKACYRYYERWGAGGGPFVGSSARVPWADGQMLDPNTGWMQWLYKEPKRVAPSHAYGSALTDFNFVCAGQGVAPATMSQGYSDHYGSLMYIDSTVSHGAAFACMIYPINADAYWAAWAEL